MGSALMSNESHHWRRASDVKYETEAQTRRPVHVPCYASCAQPPEFAQESGKHVSKFLALLRSCSLGV